MFKKEKGYLAQRKDGKVSSKIFTSTIGAYENDIETARARDQIYFMCRDSRNASSRAVINNTQIIFFRTFKKSFIEKIWTDNLVNISSTTHHILVKKNKNGDHFWREGKKNYFFHKKNVNFLKLLRQSLIPRGILF